MPERNYRSITERVNELLSTSKNKSYFVAAVTVIFVVVMALAGILPAFSAFGFQAEENSRRIELIGKLEKKLSVSKKLVQEQGAKGDLVAFFAKVFPNEPGQDLIIEDVNDLTKKHGIFLQNISFSGYIAEVAFKAKYDQRVKFQTASLIIQGDLQKIQDLVKDVEGSRRIFHIKTLVVSRKTGADLVNSPKDREYSATILFEYYYYDREAIQ